MDDIRKRLEEFKASMERPRADAVTRAKPATEFQKSFDEYRMAQQYARERLLSELPGRAVSGAIPGAVGALSGYAAQFPGIVGDMRDLYESFKPESAPNVPEILRSLPTTERLQEYYMPEDASPEMKAGMVGGNAVALGQGVAALPGLVKGVAKGTPKVLGNLIDEILAPRSGLRGQRGAVGVKGKVPSGEAAQKLAQKRAALPVDQGGLGLPKNNTSEQRAEAMGFTGEGYHGSLYDIEKFNPNKASTEGFAARGTYITDSPEDASLNYADIFGPDVKGKVERQMDILADDRNSISRIGRRFQDEVLTPRQQEILLANTINADNLGTVYPLRYRADKPIHLDRPQEKEVYLGPFERYDEANDVYVDTPHTGKFENALQEFSDYGGETNPIREFAADYGDEIPADALYRAVQKQAAKDWLSDPDSGELVSSGVAAGDFLKHFGVDEIAHTPDFRNQQLNIGTKHTVAMNPENIRSRFAAFDPFRRNSAIAAAMGVAAPDLMAKEKKRGGAVSQDVMNMAVMNQKVQKRGAGGVMKVARTFEEAKRLYDIAKLSRSRAAQEAAGLYHPIGGGMKLSKPVEMMRFDTVKDPTVKGVERRIITAEDLQGGRGIPLTGDRAAAGRLLTSVEGKQFAEPLPLEGGGEYMLTHTIPGSPESSVWRSDRGVITKLQNQIKFNRDSGKPIYGVNIVGAPTNVNFNTMVTEALLNQYDPTSLTKKAKKEFLKDIRNYVPDPKKPHLKPGANLTEADLNDVEALRAKMLEPGAGPLRKAFVERLDQAPFQEAGFPDVAAARLATTEPSLLDVPTGTAGFTIGKLDPAARALEQTPRGHRTYPIALGGEYYGSLDNLVDFRDIFQGFADKRRLFGKPEASDLRSFSLSPQVQEFDQEWLDRYMKLQGANNPREFNKGGVVQNKADGGLTSDDLVLEERML
jgi:hypothetical protein